MAIRRSVLQIELLMSAHRVITAAETATSLAGEWPPATVVGHLSMVDTDVWLPRIDLMVAGRAARTPPHLTWWEPDGAQTVARFAGSSTDDAGAGLLASRTAVLRRLRTLTDDEWDARADHDVFGSIDVEGLLLQLLAHDEEHRATLVLGGRPDLDYSSPRSTSE